MLHWTMTMGGYAFLCNRRLWRDILLMWQHGSKFYIMQNMLTFARKYSESHQNSLNHKSKLLFLSRGRILHVVQPCVLLTLSFRGNYRTHLWLMTMISSYVESNQGDGHSKKVSRDPSQNYQTMKLSFLINLSYLPSCFLVYFSASTFTKTVNFAEGNLGGNSTHRSLSWCLIPFQTPTSSNSYSLLETPRLLEFHTCWWLRVLIHWLVQRQVG